MPRVLPEILSWARQTAGYDLEEAARRIGLNATRAGSGSERLAALEAGDGEPSVALLSRMAKQYHRPLLTFYLPKVPERADVGQDFRTLPEQGDPANTILGALLRDIKARQALVRELIEDDEDALPVPFVGSRRVADGVHRIAQAIVDALEFDRNEYRLSRNSDEAFNYLRTCSEDAGVYVILAGNLGSWQTSIDVEIFRGFAIADARAPFVVINDQDAKVSWAFTLLHELAHLCIGASGVSGGGVHGAGVERLCNDVAAAILVDDDEILALGEPLGTAIDRSARDWRVSRSMIAYRLFRNGRIDEAQWRIFVADFRRQWLETRENVRAIAREREGGPNYYVVRRHRIGSALINLVRRSLSEGAVTPTRAAKMLGVKPMAVYPLLANGPLPNRVA